MPKVQSHEWEQEKQIMRQVYACLDSRLQEADAEVAAAERELASGRFEERYRASVVADLTAKQKKRREVHRLMTDLLPHPYFAHICVKDTEVGADTDYLFSASPELEAPCDIKGEGDRVLLPFKRLPGTPLIDRLMQYYSMPSARPISVAVQGSNGIRYDSTYDPQLVRNVTISDRILKEVTTLFSAVEEAGEAASSGVDVDEFLARRLEENRSDARLRNIIETLQRQQFEIIQTETRKSFVVQGCAGSGKTQCLIHRLFFLRGELSENGWSRTLLITPSQVFRNYSAELMQRFRLTGIRNHSLAEFYRVLLDAFDKDFKKRQYRFELSEEYLPDGYLAEVYRPENMQRIRREIRAAVEAHVAEACRLVDEPFVPGRTVKIAEVERLELRLRTELMRMDEAERRLSVDPEYQKHRTVIDQLDRELPTLENRLETMLETRQRHDDEEAEFERLRAALTQAEADVRHFHTERAAALEPVMAELDRSAAALKDSVGSDRILRMSDYAAALGALNERAADTDETRYLTLLEEAVQEARETLLRFTDGRNEAEWRSAHARLVRTNQERITAAEQAIDRNRELLRREDAWLEAHDVERASEQRRSHHEALTRAQRYLRAIESGVFEQEVWKALTPLKEQYGIRAVEVEKQPDGTEKRTRILYKSDLLFYLRVYMELHDSHRLPPLDLICVDEGQDLNREDYAALRELYPRATLNIFGDTVQSLHTNCGITDWQRDTGISTVYRLTTNYRNTPAVVDFCRRTFGIDMAYCGRIRPEQAPILPADLRELALHIADGSVTIIVRDREAYERLLKRLGYSDGDFEFLDTRSNADPTGTYRCYSVFAAKGLEFTRVLVYAEGMTMNQRIVACTRAMEQLYYFE